MPTKPKTKTAPRKPAIASKPPAKVASSAKAAPVKAAPESKRSTAAPGAKARPSETPQPAADAPKPAPKPAMETLSLIDEKKPRAKRAESDGTAKRSVLPPISRIREKTEAPIGPVSPAPAPAPVAPPAAEASPEAAPDSAEAESAQKIIHIKPPIIVKDLALQLGLKNFQLIKELMDDYNIFANPNLTVEPDVATQICAKHGF